MEFQKFDKIPRLSREILISEKIDGTNGQVAIIKMLDLHDSFAGDYQNQNQYCGEFIRDYCLAEQNGLVMFAGSRTRWLDCSSNGDNYGFAKWVQANGKELFKLGEGKHYGEWWGRGIQRGYGLEERRFSLFNVGRWGGIDTKFYEGDKRQCCPKCCSVVPILYRGTFDTTTIRGCLARLATNGSKASPGFFRAEGIIIFHTASGNLFKKTIENDEKPKGKQ